ncbi:hypothetical protein ES332_D13G051200v1 [Gossypium tomentosum]|uniref:Uncharacterized protein n=1 Tax=Gossypium tomentosum TaxID=34277 RepID=A0A5D2HU97_GOSTO|nr:hypothetical protein ES332_D13G051200v1 [Gossypium tomentosum]
MGQIRVGSSGSDLLVSGLKLGAGLDCCCATGPVLGCTTGLVQRACYRPAILFFSVLLLGLPLLLGLLTGLLQCGLLSFLYFFPFFFFFLFFFSFFLSFSSSSSGRILAPRSLRSCADLLRPRWLRTGSSLPLFLFFSSLFFI